MAPASDVVDQENGKDNTFSSSGGRHTESKTLNKQESCSRCQILQSLTVLERTLQPASPQAKQTILIQTDRFTVDTTQVILIIAVKPKDIVHVGAALPFCAESLDVKLANLFDGIVGTLNVLQLALVPLQTGKKKKAMSGQLPMRPFSVLVTETCQLFLKPALMHRPQMKCRQSNCPSTSKAFCSLNSCVMSLVGGTLKS